MNTSVPPLPRAGAKRPRGPWQVQRNVLFALVLREMKARVGGQWVGAIWTLIEPLAHVLMMMTLYSAISGSGALPGLEFPVFLATGLIPFSLFQNLSNRLKEAVDANRGLFAYRQVKPFDTFVSRALVEGLMNMLVYVVTLSLLAWAGYHVLPSGPLEMMGVHALLFLLGMGFGVFAAVASHDRPRLRSFLRMIMLPLYLATGIIFPIHLAPPDLLDMLLYNPLLHLVELSRHAFMTDYQVVRGVNLVYPTLFTLVLCTLAMLMYRANRLRLVTSV